MTEIASPVPPPIPGATSPGVSRDIYGMPMFANVSAPDIDATCSWYTDGLGFITLFTIPGPDGTPALVHLRRWQFQDILVRPAAGSVTPGTACTISFAAVYDEIDDLAAQARAHGGGRVDGPVDTPWNTRDVTTIGPEGVTVVFTAARPQDQSDPRFAEKMRDWKEQQEP